MPLILSLETSTDVCSVAVHDGKKCLAEIVIREPQAHAAKLAPAIQLAMMNSGVTFEGLQAVAVSSGPGSYTGLRIGTSTAKGLCLSLEIPLIAVGTLEILAYQGSLLNATNALLCPMIDARRMEVYAMVATPSLQVIKPVSAIVVEETTFSELLEEKQVLFFGNGADKCKSVVKSPNAFFLDEVTPLASALGEMADSRFTAGSIEDLNTFKPFYLKEFVAKKAQSRI